MALHHSCLSLKFKKAVTIATGNMDLKGNVKQYDTCKANLTHDWVPYQPNNKTDQMSHAHDDICE